MTSTLVVDPLAVAEVTEHGSGATLVVRDCGEPGAALVALRLAADDLWDIPRPTEPAAVMSVAAPQR